MVNDSWQDMRVRVAQTQAGAMLYSKPFNSTTGVGVTAPYTWAEVAIPADVAHIVGIDIRLKNGRTRTLEHLSFSRRNEFFDAPTFSGVRVSAPISVST